MSNNPGVGSTSSSTSTSSNQLDYLALLGGLNPLPFDPNTVINAMLLPAQSNVQGLQTQINNIKTNESIFQSISNDAMALQSAAFNLTLQSSVQANVATSSSATAVTASASPSVQAGTYTVAVGAVATATVAKSSAALGTAINGTTPLNQLNLNATATAGSFSVVVDGHVRTVNVDVTKSLTDPAGTLTLLQQQITAGLNADAGVTAGVSVVGNKIQVTLSGGTQSHTISFGAVGDTSNFLSVMNLSTQQGTQAGGGSLTLTSSANVGVAQANNTLAMSNILTSLNASGSFSINGVSFSYTAGTDTLSAVLGRINNSSAGVIASYDAVNDKVVLTNKTTGQTAINLADTGGGNFLAAMGLQPGGTASQTLGANASVTVNGNTVTSTSNAITTAVPGMTINALALTGGTPATITVSPDVTGITTQIQSFVTAANKVLSDINLTQQKDATSGKYSSLLGNTTLVGLQNSLITMMTGRVKPAGSTYQSLADVGITTSAVAVGAGIPAALSVNTTKLTAALNANPAAVASLFNGTTAANGFQGMAQQLNTFLTQQANPSLGIFAQFQTSGDAQIKSIQNQITQLNDNITAQRQMLTAQFSAMATVLLNLSQTAGLFTSSSSSLLSSTAVPTSSSSSSSTGQ